MNQDKMKKYGELLNKRKSALEDTLSKIKKNEKDIKESFLRVELSKYDNHPADTGTDLFQEGMNNALKTRHERDVYEIDRALLRIEKGNYGICELCGKEIDEKRLDVLPQAGTCIECKTERFAGHEDTMKTRPVEEKVLAPRFDLGGYSDYMNFYNNEQDEQGKVDSIELISNREYKKQLPK